MTKHKITSLYGKKGWKTSSENLDQRPVLRARSTVVRSWLVQELALRVMQVP